MTTFGIVKRGGWAELQPDLLDEIAKHIPSYDDYVRVRAVCKSWNIALPKISRHITGPWLVLPFDDETLKMIKKKKNMKAYHLRLRLPELQNTHIRGSSFGWLISVGIDGELRMLNPFTNSHFHLPPLSSFPGVFSYQPDKHGQEYTLTEKYGEINVYTIDSIAMQEYYVLKIVLSSSPEEEDFMAVAIYGRYYNLALYRAGDDKWTDVEVRKTAGGYQDVIFHKGKIYAIDLEAHLHEFDVETLVGGIIETELERPYPYTLFKYHKYLVRSPDGHLLMVVRGWDEFSKTTVGNESLYGHKTDVFYIFKLEESTKRWWRVFSLGNYVLVVGYNSSIWKPSFADDEGNCARNCIYYTDHDWGCGHDIGVFNLEDRKCKQLFPNSAISCPDPNPYPVWLFLA